MKLYLDDIRTPPMVGDWTLCRTYAEAQRFVEANHGQITHMALDHDLGILSCRACMFKEAEEPCFDGDTEISCDCTCHVMSPSGHDFLKWINENNYWPQNKPTVHSANPVGSRNMRNFIEDFGPYKDVKNG